MTSKRTTVYLSLKVNTIEFRLAGERGGGAREGLRSRSPSPAPQRLRMPVQLVEPPLLVPLACHTSGHAHLTASH